MDNTLLAIWCSVLSVLALIPSWNIRLLDWKITQNNQFLSAVTDLGIGDMGTPRVISYWGWHKKKKNPNFEICVIGFLSLICKSHQ